MDWRERITIEPGKRSGKPCIKGTRITVADIFSYLAAGEMEETMRAEWTYLTHEDFLAVYAHAAVNEDWATPTSD